MEHCYSQCFISPYTCGYPGSHTDAGNGFEALHILRGAQPDLLVSELNLPQMSGFELLSVVRTRFPLISVIAMSGEFTAVTVPHEAICDHFVGKGPNVSFELLAAARTLISGSPLRGSRPRSELAPVWVPRSATGYVILTCPECLRSFSVPEPRANPSRDSSHEWNTFDTGRVCPA